MSVSLVKTTPAAELAVGSRVLFGKVPVTVTNLARHAATVVVSVGTPNGALIVRSFPLTARLPIATTYRSA